MKRKEKFSRLVFLAVSIICIGRLEYDLCDSFGLLLKIKTDD